MKNKNDEWWDHSINPVHIAQERRFACAKISTGCKNCYAEKINKRFFGGKNYKYNAKDLFVVENKAFKKLPKKKPRIVFVQNMSDLFYERVRSYTIDNVISLASSYPIHNFMFLTKRAERLYDYLQIIKLKVLDIERTYDKIDISKFNDNLWFGVTFCTQKEIDEKAEFLTKARCWNKYISLEPLLEPIVLPESLLKEIKWIIIGGETGQNARQCNEDWVLEIIMQACANDIPVFFKKFGDGKTTVYEKEYREKPAALLY